MTRSGRWPGSETGPGLFVRSRATTRPPESVTVFGQPMRVGLSPGGLVSPPVPTVRKNVPQFPYLGPQPW